MPWHSLATSCRSSSRPSLRELPRQLLAYSTVRQGRHALVHVQAKRDEEFLEEYRRQAHAALLKDPYSTSFSEEILQKNPRVKSVIKYKHQIPGDGSSFSSSSQVTRQSQNEPDVPPDKPRSCTASVYDIQ